MSGFGEGMGAGFGGPDDEAADALGPIGDWPYAYQPDHQADAQSLLVTQFRDRESMNALVRALSAPAQALEDAVWRVLTQRGLNDAIGMQLDALGQIIGLERQGFDDEHYRIHLLAKILANRSSDTTPEMQAVFKAMLPESSPILIDRYPAAFTLEVQNAVIEPAYHQLYWSIANGLRSPGVRMVFISWPAPIEEMFTFDGGLGLGWGDATDPDVGGVWASAV